MREIEVKARVKGLEVIVKKLAALGCRMSAPIVQHDTIFTKPDIEFNNAPKGTNWLRIRITNGQRATFNLKCSHENELVSTEFEADITNPKALTEILKQLGYLPAVEVKKTRRQGKLGDLAVCVDEVDGLGSFIELEKMTKDTTPGEQVQKELFETLKKFGVSEKDRVLKGYDTLIYAKKNKSP